MTNLFPPPRSLLASRLVTAVSIVLALLTMAAALVGFLELSSAGFPDGGITDYERAAHFPRTILLGMTLVLGGYLFRLAVPNLDVRARIILVIGVVLMLGVLLAVAEIAIPWYFVSHLGLNDGRGG